jgi:ABC-type amino acid transport substrate-binding protein
VGVLVGTPEATSAAHDLPARVTVQRFATAAGLYAALADGTVAAVYADLSLNASQQITHRDLVSAYVRRTSVQDAIAVSSSAPDLVGDLNRGLAAVRADGTYRDLYRRYFSVSPS